MPGNVLKNITVGNVVSAHPWQVVSFENMQHVKVFKCYDMKTKVVLGYAGEVADNVYGPLQSDIYLAAKSAKDIRDSLNVTRAVPGMSDYSCRIKTSVGTQVDGCPIGLVPAYDTNIMVYECYDIKSGKQYGFVGRVTDDKYGPLCKNSKTAAIAAYNIFCNGLKQRQNNKQK